MAYQIEEYSDRIEIAIDAPPAERGSFLDLLDACTQGERACPALRCGTVETRALADGTLRIKVMPLPDMQLDRQLIERCLAFTLGCGKRCCAGGSAWSKEDAATARGSLRRRRAPHCQDGGR